MLQDAAAAGADASTLDAAQTGEAVGQGHALVQTILVRIQSWGADDLLIVAAASLRGQ
jgi:hypothetical protein